jgi:hypothetical protein
MTVAEAKAILARPLVFGDAEQLAADRFLVAIDEVIEDRNQCREEHGRYCDCWREWLAGEMYRAVIDRILQQKNIPNPGW